MSDWRDIETAPKDGTMFLAFEPGCVHVCPIFLAYWTPQGLLSRYNGSLGNPRPPTHWMPLPAPPEAKCVNG
jgi:hypothetical protein